MKYNKILKMKFLKSSASCMIYNIRPYKMDNWKQIQDQMRDDLIKEILIKKELKQHIKWEMSELIALIESGNIDIAILLLQQEMMFGQD